MPGQPRVQGLQHERSRRQGVERQHIPVSPVSEVSQHGLDDGLGTADDEPVSEGGVRRVQHARETYREAVERALPVDERHECDGPRAVLHE